MHSGSDKTDHHSGGIGRKVREQLLRMLVEELEEGVANLSTSGEILYANSRFAQLMNTRPERRKVVGRNLRDLISNGSWDDLNTALTQGACGPVEGEIKVDTEPAGPRVIRLSLGPVRLGKRTTIRAVAREVTELMEKTRALEESEASLHSLSARILQLQDEERRRIARDLHDITGQELAVVVMSLSSVAKELDRPGAEGRQVVLDALELVRKIEHEVRSLSYLLHPPLLDEFGIGSALEWYAEGFQRRSGITVEVECPRGLPRLSAEKEVALFRVVQEGLTNVLRHSGSRKAWIRLSNDPTGVHVSIEDEGCGIKADASGEVTTRAGVGILSMRERLHQLGGVLEVRPRSRGTQLLASVFLDDADRAASSAGVPVVELVNGAEMPRSETGRHRRSPVSHKRILIADDHEVTRRGIRALLEEERDLEICGEARDGFEVVQKARELNPDLIIMDINMPHAGGFSAANRIRELGTVPKIIFFTTHTLGELERMSRIAGFEGFVYKTDAAQDLVRGVRAVLEGNTFYNLVVVRSKSA
jgi:two-component system, NarL family, sensor kinase